METADSDILPWNIPTSAYLHGESATAAEVSAIDADVSSWPPVFMTWGSDEMFRDAIRIFADHLERQGVVSVTSEADGMFHVYPILMPWAETSREAYREAGEFVRTRVTEAADASSRRARKVRRKT